MPHRDPNVAVSCWVVALACAAGAHAHDLPMDDGHHHAHEIYPEVMTGPGWGFWLGGDRDAGRSGAPAVVIEFDGSLPPEATLSRASARLDSGGNLVGIDQPRFETALVTPGAELVVGLPGFERVIGVGRVGDDELAVLTFNSVDIGLVDAMYRAGGGEDVVWPHRSVQDKFGVTGDRWGSARTAQIYPDGTLLIHTSGAGEERRSYTVRSSIQRFDRAEAWDVTRVSDYAPPATRLPTYIAPVFTRLCYLPNLDRWVSAVAEYRTPGPQSSLDPSDGRSLGYASADGGLTWTRVVDTDDDDLGRPLVDRAKHPHHVEAFEWQDEGTGQWNVGAVSSLGDRAGEAGQIWTRSPGPAFVPEGQNALMDVARTKRVKSRALTDLFPLDPSDEAGPGGMRFIQGQDRELAGIFDMVVDGTTETNRALFRPVIASQWRELDPRRVQLPIYPYIFQMDRLGRGEVVASLNDGRDDLNPNGFWISDPTCEHWATAWLIDEFGYQGIMPVGEDLFWTLAIVGTSTDKVSRSELWRVRPPVVRRALCLGVGAAETRDFPWFQPSAELLIEDVTGQADPPEALPADTPVFRMFSETMPDGAQLGRLAMAPASASPGDVVSVRYWIRNAAPDASAARLEHSVRVNPAGGGAPTFEDSLSVQPETTEWVPVTIVQRWPDDPGDQVEAICQIIGDATPDRPIHYEFTAPRLVRHTQWAIQEPNGPGQATAPDRLAVDLPALGPEWTVAVWATEAPAFAASLTDGAGVALTVCSAPGPDGWIYKGADLSLAVERWSGGAPEASLRSIAQDVVVPTQNLVVFRRSQPGGAVDAWVSRGMGAFERFDLGAMPDTPTALVFERPDGAVGHEGLVHRVEVWTATALTDGEIIDRRVSFEAATRVACAGDVNGDGAVNVLDFAALADHFGAGPDATRAQGDLNGDGVVDIADFGVLADGFGCGR
jgi:hypothetical protein